VALAAGLLALMGLAGFGYGVVTLVVTPGVVHRFKAAAAGTDAVAMDNYVTVLWIGAALGLVVALLLFALSIVLALGVRRGSNPSRVGVWVICGLGLLAGCASAATVGVQRSGDEVAGTVGAALGAAYPGGWIATNVVLSVAQILGYLAVAVLLLVSPRAFFGRAATVPDAHPAFAGIPSYGQPASHGPAPVSSQPGYAASPPGYAASPPGYAPQLPGPEQVPPVAPRPSGPDDEYWSRPSS
jgi:hypothetical protein